MIIETLTGRYNVTACSPDLTAPLHVTASTSDAIRSLLDSIELVGGALGEDRSFTDADIEATALFGRPAYRVTVSRAELIRFLQAEVLSYLDYTSLNAMHRSQKAVTAP